MRFFKDVDDSTCRFNYQMDASLVINQIYLGSYEKAAVCKEALRKHNITHILTIGYEMEPINKDAITYHVVLLDDEPEVEISKHFYECFQFIDKALEKKESNLLIHCWAGISRSATITIAYLIYKFGMDYMEAFEHVRRARHWIGPNQGFRNQLKSFSKTINHVYDYCWDDYDKCIMILYYMHRRQKIESKDSIFVCNTFIQSFGSTHPYTIDVVKEMSYFVLNKSY